MRKRRLSYPIAVAGALALAVASGGTMAQAATGSGVEGIGQAHADAPSHALSPAGMRLNTRLWTRVKSGT